jgi:uncharacterized membrane protein
MDETKKNIGIACSLLKMYEIAVNVSSDEIKKFKTYKSNLYGMQHIYSFDYRNKQYYITDDYSLMDKPKLIRDIIEEIKPNLKGHALINPIPQSDGAKYASGLDGIEYYLWEVPA